jgi:hypothetical protein
MGFTASKNLKRALVYARKRWRVFPISANDKDPPCIAGWPTKATTDPATIKAWWRQFPGANVGLLCGPSSGVFVLDIDVKGDDGEATLKALERRHGKLPLTREHSTPSGGRHLFFICSASTNVGNRVKFAPGLDTRAGDNGYVVMPPSHTEASDDTVKGDYRLLKKRPIAIAPKWLLDLIKPQEADEDSEPCVLPAIINEGERDKTLYSYAGQLRHHGGTRKEILAALTKANTERCKPAPLLPKDLQKIAKSICRHASGQRDVDVIQKALGNATAEAVPDTAAWFDPEQHSRSLAEIMLDKDLKVRWVVRNLLAKSAVVILAGSPKTGKTTFAVHNIMHVVGLVPALGSYQAVKGAENFAIGYFNEMGEVNFKKAVKDVKPDITNAEIRALRATVRIYAKWPQLDARGLQQLEASIVKHGFRIFVIDTIARVRPFYKGISVTEADAKLISGIADIARRTKCCIVVMTQGNKHGGDTENITDRLAHTNQFAAAADDIVTIYRKKNDATRQRYLQCVGRNVQESDEMILTLDHEGLKIPGTTYALVMSETQQRVIDCLKAAVPNALTPIEIATNLNAEAERKGIKKVSRENIRNVVSRMLNAQTVVHVGKRGGVTTPTIATTHWPDQIAADIGPKAFAKALPKALSKALRKALPKGTAKGTAKGQRGV